MAKFFWTLTFLGLSLPLFSQAIYELPARNSGPMIGVNVFYSIGWPGGDLSQRYGQHFTVGGSVEYMTEKSNWSFGPKSFVLFGNRVKEDVIANMRTSEGEIIGRDELLSSVVLRERGYFFGFQIGKLITLGKGNPRSGIRLSLAPGYFEHKIRIQDDSRLVDQVSGDYKKGYDRLNGGFAINEFIGYQVLGKNRRVNFTIGFEITQAFTTSRRSYQFDLMAPETGNRLDWLYNIQLRWTLPFYQGERDEIFY